MKPRPKLHLIWILLLTVLLFSFPVDARVQPASAQTASECNLTWKVVPSPNPGSKWNVLTGVSGINENDMWAVGEYRNSDFDYHSMILHWNGAEWTSSAHGDVVGGLWAIKAISSNDVWAVGGFDRFDNPPESTGAALHWDGSAWSVIPGLEKGGLAISTLAADDVWFAGNDIAAYHWNGVSMERFSLIPPQLPNESLTGIKAFSDNDVWVIGNWFPGSVEKFTIVYHWDGSSWSVIPKPTNFDPDFRGVDGSASNDIWVVGDSRDGGWQRTRAVHWNGSIWTQTLVPRGIPWAKGGSEFDGLFVRQANDAWAVGSSFSEFINSAGKFRTQNRPLIQHWNGDKWRTEVIQDSQAELTQLRDVVTLSAENVWAVGGTRGKRVRETRILNGSLPCIEKTVTPDLLYPRDQTAVAVPILFDWTDVIDATGYDIQIWRGNSAEPILTQTVKESRLQVDRLIASREVYRWRVRACNELGCSDWSQAWRFRVE